MSSFATAASLPARNRQVARRSGFATTQWSAILRARQDDSPGARASLAQLCRTYWYPLYAHIRRRGYDGHDAEDLTQSFFARLLQNGMLSHADPKRGRFRSFMLTSLNHFLADQRDQQRAAKRGGDRDILSLDLSRAEHRFDLDIDGQLPPDRAFDRQWALTLLDAVLNRLDAEYRRQRRAKLFLVLKPTLVGSRESQPYAALAASLGLSEGAVKVAVHRLRKRYRQLLLEEIARTVASPGETRDELGYLFQSLVTN